MLLAIDTSTQWMGVALYTKDGILGELTWKSQYHHTVELAPSIDAVLVRCGIKPAELVALAVALGPGSFTSLRIGLAHAKGMALALHIPLIGIPTLDVLAAGQAPDDRPLAAFLQAGRGRLAFNIYHWNKKRWESEGDARLANALQLVDHLPDACIVMGELTGEDRSIISENLPHAEIVSPSRSLRRTGFLAEMAWKRYMAGESIDPANIAPIYLHINQGIPTP